MAAVRESFEETGILLAGEDEQDVVERSSTPELMTWREAVADQDKSFAHFLSSSGLSIRADLLRPVARWQSPGLLPQTLRHRLLHHRPAGGAGPEAAARQGRVG